MRQALRGIGIFESADHQRVEACDRIVGQPEVGLRGLRLWVGPGKSMQGAVQHWFAAAERVYRVLLRRLFNPQRRHNGAASSYTIGCLNNCATQRQFTRLGIQRLPEGFQLMGDNPKALPQCQRFFGAGQLSVQHKVADRATLGAGRRRQRALGSRCQSQVQFF